MRQLQLDFFQQMRALAAASEPSEVAGLMTLHLLQWDPGQDQKNPQEGGKAGRIEIGIPKERVGSDSTHTKELPVSPPSCIPRLLLPYGAVHACTGSPMTTWSFMLSSLQCEPRELTVEQPK